MTSEICCIQLLILQCQIFSLTFLEPFRLASNAAAYSHVPLVLIRQVQVCSVIFEKIHRPVRFTFKASYFRFR